MTCIICDNPIKVGLAGAMGIMLHPQAREELGEMFPSLAIDALLEDHGICGDCVGAGQAGSALFKLINLAAKGGN